jgi:hypothetical protein
VGILKPFPARHHAAGRELESDSVLQEMVEGHAEPPPSKSRKSLGARGEKDRRGIEYGELLPLADGSKNTLWTNVTLRQFSDGEVADATPGEDVPSGERLTGR